MFFPPGLLNKDRQKFLPAVVLLGGRRGGAKSVKFESLVSGQEVGGPPAAVEERGGCCAAPEGRIPQLFPFYSRSWQVDLPTEVSVL